MKKIIFSFIVILAFVLTACESQTVVIDFVTNGDTQIESLELEKGERVSTPQEPLKEGFTFIGWYLDSELTTEFHFQEDTVSEDLTLYAKWEVVTYDITFLGFNGEELASYMYGFDEDLSEMVIPEVQYQDGYIYLGWDRPLITEMPNDDVIYQAVFGEVRIEELQVGGDDERTYLFGDYIVGIKREYGVRATLTILKLSDEEFRKEIVIEGEDENSIRSFHINGDMLIVDAGLYDDTSYYHSMSLHIYNLEDSESEEIISQFILEETSYSFDKVLYSEEFYMILTNIEGEGKVIVKSLIDPSYEVLRDVLYSISYNGSYSLVFNDEYFVVQNMDTSSGSLNDEVVFDIYRFNDDSYHRSISSDYIIGETSYFLEGDLLRLIESELVSDVTNTTYHFYSLSDETFFFSSDSQEPFPFGGFFSRQLKETNLYVIFEQYLVGWRGDTYLEAITVYDKEDLVTEIISLTNVYNYIVSGNYLIYLASTGEEDAPINLYIMELEDPSNIRTYYSPEEKFFTDNLYVVEDYVIVFNFNEGDGYSVFKLSDSAYRHEISFDSMGVGYANFNNLDFSIYDWSNKVIYLYNLDASEYEVSFELGEVIGLSHLIAIHNDYIIISIGDEVYIIDISKEAY